MECGQGHKYESDVYWILLQGKELFFSHFRNHIWLHSRSGWSSLPDPATAYSTEQILAFGPTIEQAWLHTDFIANFVATTPFSDRMELVADDLLEGLGPAFAALLATPDTTGGYLINPSGKDFQICSGGRMSPTNIEF